MSDDLAFEKEHAPEPVVAESPEAPAQEDAPDMDTANDTGASRLLALGCRWLGSCLVIRAHQRAHLSR